MFIIAHLISFLLGYFSLSLIFKETRYYQSLLHLSLSIITGLCLSAYLTFFVFLLFNKFYAWLIVGLNLLSLLGVILLNLKTNKNIRTLLNPFRIHKLSFFSYSVICAFTLLIALYYYVASVHPHGEWDAWAMWNMKMKFLLLSSAPLDDILTNLSWHTHPDYPLLLPLINVWLNSFSHTHMLYVPFITCILLTVSCAMFMYTGLSLFIKKGYALLATLILGFHPYFAFSATQQYADILIALFVLISLICFYLLDKESNPAISILAGLNLGFLTFAKNEGIVFAALLSVIFLIRLWQQRNKQKSNLPCYVLFLITLLIACLPTIIFKLFLAPPNSDILPNISQTGLQMINVNRLAVIFDYLGKEIIHKKWCYIWMLILIMVITKLFKFLKKETLWVTLFFLSYFIIIIFIYLVSTQTRLNWWIPYSLPRIYFYLLPAILFHVFYVYWPQNKKIENT